LIVAHIDWVAVSSIVTAGATLVLAFATFASVRSANRSSRVAERSLLAGLRPLLVPARPDDPETKIGFAGNKWFHVPGGQAAVEVTDDVIYLAIPVRNVGSGIAVLHGWRTAVDVVQGREAHAPVEEFHELTRDLYIAPEELGFWQGAFREPGDPLFAEAREAILEPRRFYVDVLYGDHELGQRSITRFGIMPRDDGLWLAVVGRHWNVDRPDPR
jgi:hypothetical protein